MNGSRPRYVTPYKKKLWNSLELSHTLIVDNVTVDHTGKYTCTVSSGLMEKSASAFLKVYSRCRNIPTNAFHSEILPFLNAKRPFLTLFAVVFGTISQKLLIKVFATNGSLIH